MAKEPGEPLFSPEPTPGENGPETYALRSVIIEQRKKGTDGPWHQYGAAQDKEAGQEVIDDLEELQKRPGWPSEEMEYRMVPPLNRQEKK